LVANSVVGVLVLFLYLVAYHFLVRWALKDALIHEEASLKPFYFHYLALLFVFVIIMLLLASVRKASGSYKSGVSLVTLWFSMIILVFALSNELGNLIVLKGYEPPTAEQLADQLFSIKKSYKLQKKDLLDQVRKIGFPILWGTCSFIFMVIGMRKTHKHLRIIALSLFFVTLLKLFAFDVWEMSAGGKIASFLSLGVILLVVSFLYQKLKKLILEDNVEKENE